MIYKYYIISQFHALNGPNPWIIKKLQIWDKFGCQDSSFHGKTVKPNTQEGARLPQTFLQLDTTR